MTDVIGENVFRIPVFIREGNGIDIVQTGVDSVMTINLSADAIGITPLLYGAAGDGTTDDTTAINAMFAAARASLDTELDRFTAATINGLGLVYRVTSTVDITMFTVFGLVMRDMTFLFDFASPSIGLDFTGTQGAVMECVNGYTSPTSVLTFAIVHQRVMTIATLADKVAGYNNWSNSTFRVAATDGVVLNYASEHTTFEDCGFYLLHNSPSTSPVVTLQSDNVLVSAPSAFISSPYTTNTELSSFNNPQFNRCITRHVAETNWRITSITNANPAVCTYTLINDGVDPVNGDVAVFGSPSGMTELEDVLFTVANVNTGAGTFELAGINSTSYGVFSGTTAPHYRTGPGFSIYGSDRVVIDGNNYIVVYGNDAVRYVGFGITSGMILDLHVEGNDITSFLYFDTSLDSCAIRGLTIYEHSDNVTGTFFRTSGGLVNTINKMQLSILVDNSGGVMTDLFDDLTKYKVFDADFVLSKASWLPEVAAFNDFSGSIFLINEKRIVRAPGIEHLSAPMVRLNEEWVDGINYSRWKTFTGTNSSCEIDISSSANSGGRAALSVGHDAGGTLDLNGIAIYSHTDFNPSKEGVEGISDGYTSSVTTIAICRGFTDQCSVLEIPVTLAAGDIATGFADNFAAFIFDTSATTDTIWCASRKAAGTVQLTNTGLTPSTSSTAMDRYRVNIDSDGDATFYINDVLYATHTSAVTANSNYAWSLVAFNRGTAAKTVYSSIETVSMKRML